MNEERKPSHPGLKGSKGPQAVEMSAEDLAAHIRELTEQRGSTLDDKLPDLPEVSLFLAHGYDCPDYVYRGVVAPTKGRFYIVAESDIRQSVLDNRLAGFLRENSFGDDGLNAGSSGYGKIGQYDLDIVHRGRDSLKGAAYAPNIAACNVALVDLGVVPIEHVRVLQILSPFRVLDLAFTPKKG